MVQKKGQDAVCPRAEPRKSQPKPEKKHQSSHTQSGKDNKVSDSKKKLRRARSIKKIAEMENLEVNLGHQTSNPSVKSRQLPPKPQSKPLLKETSPNYMKPTTSSGARNDPPQVTAIGKSCSSPRNKGELCLSSPPSSCGERKSPVKFLVRRSSMKPAKHFLKKSKGTLLFPEVTASKATCSSILKDSKFPRELELNPGSRESEGTSVVKVCPFTYCSLNGHWHQPLPPLRSFISSRRRLLKAQKSIILKRLTSSRRRCSMKPEKEEKLEAEGTQESLDDDFFVEIYADSYPDSAESVVPQSNYEDDDDIVFYDDDEDDVDSEIFSELLSGCSNHIGTPIEALRSPSDDDSSDESCKDSFDPMREFSISEKKVIACFLEYIENQEQYAAIPDGRLHMKMESKGSLEMGSSDIDESVYDAEAYEALMEAIDVNWGEEMFEYGEGRRSGEGDYRASLRKNNMIPRCGGMEFYDQNGYTDLELQFLGEISSIGFSYQNSEPESPESSFANGAEESGGSNSTRDILISFASVGHEEGSSTKRVNVHPDEEMAESWQREGLGLEEMEFLEHFLSEANRELQMEAGSESQSEVSPIGTSERAALNLIEDDPGPAKTRLGDEDEARLYNEDHANDICTSLGESETEDEAESGPDVDCSKEPETDKNHECSFDDHQSSCVAVENGDHHLMESTGSMIHLLGSTEEGNDSPNDENIGQFEEKKMPTMGSKTKGLPLTNEDMPKVRLCTTGRNIEEDGVEEHTAFNMRAPNFLPLEPDPDAEKVDLKHREMDERRNAEDWMIDHALQEVVSRLAPARKKKVALIVEAIETVMPLPPHQSPVEHGDGNLTHTKPMQSCR